MSGSPLVRMAGSNCRKYLKTLERVKGIEPSSSAWKAVALPLSYTRNLLIRLCNLHFTFSDFSRFSR